MTQKYSASGFQIRSWQVPVAPGCASRKYCNRSVNIGDQCSGVEYDTEGESWQVPVAVPFGGVLPGVRHGMGRNSTVGPTVSTSLFLSISAPVAGFAPSPLHPPLEGGALGGKGTRIKNRHNLGLQADARLDDTAGRSWGCDATRGHLPSPGGPAAPGGPGGGPDPGHIASALGPSVRYKASAHRSRPTAEGAPGAFPAQPVDSQEFDRTKGSFRGRGEARRCRARRTLRPFRFFPA